MKYRIFFTVILFFVLAGHVFAQNDKEVPIPTLAQLQWQNAELIAVFHYDLHVFDGEKYNQKENRITPIHDYNIFNPEKLDTDQWVKSIKDAGFKMAIFTVSHETGFFFSPKQGNALFYESFELAGWEGRYSP